MDNPKAIVTTTTTTPFFTPQEHRPTKLPHIVLVPGFWEGPSAFQPLIDTLKSYGNSCTVAPLASTGHPASATSPSMKTDVAAIRKVVERVVDQDGGKTEVLMVLHSAGGFLGSMAIEGLSVGERKAAGKRGGVVRLVFVAGAVWEEGFRHGPLPFFEYSVITSLCVAIFLLSSLFLFHARQYVKSLNAHPYIFLPAQWHPKTFLKSSN